MVAANEIVERKVLIEDLIREAKIPMALDKLMDLARDLNEAYLHEVSMLKFEFSSLSEDFKNKLLPYREFRGIRNTIVSSMLELIDDILDNPDLVRAA